MKQNNFKKKENKKQKKKTPHHFWVDSFVFEFVQYFSKSVRASYWLRCYISRYM